MNAIKMFTDMKISKIHRREVLKMSEFLNTSKSTIEAEESIDYNNINKETEQSLNDYSMSLKINNGKPRPELAEINHANELNKQNDSFRYNDKILKVNETSAKEKRPRVYDYPQKLDSIESECEDAEVHNENTKPIDNFNSIHKSAEFTFSNFKGFREDDIGDDIRALSEQPYFTNRVSIINGCEGDSNPYSDRFSESVKQSTSTKKSRSVDTKNLNQVEIKAQYEITRSKFLDQESERMEAEKESQIIFTKCTNEESNLRELLNDLNLKTNQLVKLNTKKLKESQNRHINELESIKYQYENQLKYSQATKSNSNSTNRKNEFNANECKENIHKLKVEIEAKESIIFKINNETEHIKSNCEARINDLKHKIDNLNKRVQDIKLQTDNSTIDTERVQKLNDKISERNAENLNQIKKLNRKVDDLANQNILMRDIVDKLQSLVYGSEKQHISENRNSVIIEDTENRLVQDNTKKSRANEEHKHCNSDMPGLDYTDTYRNNQSTMLNSNHVGNSISINPGLLNLCNQSQIKSVKVYKFNSPGQDKILHQNLKTTRKTQKISSKVFKKFLKDYQDKSRIKSRESNVPIFTATESSNNKDNYSSNANPYQGYANDSVKILKRQHFDKSIRPSRYGFQNSKP